MVSIIIPTLNEEEGIATLLQSLDAVCLHIPHREIVIIDDASHDQTVERAMAASMTLKTPVRVISRTERGLASAVVRGFTEASGDVVLVMDADLSHPVSVVPKLIAALHEHGADLVVASRLIPGGGVEDWPFHRRMFSRGATLLARPISKGVCDPMSGFFVMKKNVITGVKLEPKGYKILLEVIVKGKTGKIVEIPYIFCNRLLGKSKLNGHIMQEYIQHLGALYLHRTQKFLSKHDKALHSAK